MRNLYRVRFTFELNEPNHPYKSEVKTFEREIDFSSSELIKDIENFVFREGGVAKIKSFSQCKLSDDAQEVHLIIHPKKTKTFNQLNKSMKKLSHLKPKVIQDCSKTDILIAPTPITFSSRKNKKNTPE